MTGSEFANLGDVVLDEAFPDVDLALRRGRHIDRDDGAWYSLLVDGQALLEEFYRRYGCELIHKSDGFFYLLPTGDQLGRRQLSLAEMLVGQGLALLLLDPSTVESGGVVSRDQILSHLSRVMGMAALTRALNPKKKRLDERVAEETVRNRVGEALRRLATLGFVEPVDAERLRLRTALMRFAEPVRGLDSPAQGLEQLVKRGEVVLESREDSSGDDTDPADEDEPAPEQAEAAPEALDSGAERPQKEYRDTIPDGDTDPPESCDDALNRARAFAREIGDLFDAADTTPPDAPPERDE